MSEQTAPTTGTEETNNEQGAEGAKEFQAITSQEDFDKAIQARIARERAKIPADYDELKTAKVELDKIRDAQKTETEKAAERLAAAEKRANELEAKALRAEVANAKGIPAALLSGGTQEELEASADALIAFRGEVQPQKLHIPNEGKSPTNSSSPGSEFAAFLNSQLGHTPA